VALLPARVRGFLDDYARLDREDAAAVRRARAQLQLVLHAAYVWNDGRIELEFRGRRLAARRGWNPDRDRVARTRCATETHSKWNRSARRIKQFS
jgi:hypothetical protein